MNDGSRVGIPTAPFGSSGGKITRLGLGGWAFGGTAWEYSFGPQNDGDSIAVVQRAVELGIGWIDTASVYGYGHSESIIARALNLSSGLRRPLLFTKGGLVRDPAAATSDVVLEPRSLRREVASSCSRLGVERIDLYQVHWPPSNADAEAVQRGWQALVDLRDEGLIRWIGVSNFDVSLLEACEEIAHVDSLQLPLNLLRREAAAELVPWCRRNRTAVLCYSPLASGLFAGRFAGGDVETLPFDHWRRTKPDLMPPRLERSLALADRVRELSARRGCSLQEVALAWVLAWPGVTGAIVGAQQRDEVDDWAGAANLRLDATELDEIAAALEETGAGSGPVHPGNTDA